ncbi:M61 family metallopeptidase [Pareuzebyella sediminis]|uniref:M61 family metallopeptidase n=1 Tax=Pareuzebyella sediminis TaxID=2607998 RepID=UPI0011ED583B|nr:PDZ domain-containing protein [Pareuzebyella sediminis]
MKTYIFWFCLFTASAIEAQTISYEISFENAVHHEARINANFPNLKNYTVAFRMSRTSPGRYALHEFAKNVYDVKATNHKGKPLTISRPDPYQWLVSGHDGTINLSYTLFANRADGTYSQVDETHAHLNIPATFMYAPQLHERDIEITFKVRKDLKWKVATQLPLVSGTTYTAPNLSYFMDSPVEISDYGLREFETPRNGKNQKIRFVLHHNGTDQQLDAYFEKVKKIVMAEKRVFGELPDFDYGTYTFLACYVANASGDGMEHRNSTVLTSSRGLAEGGMEGNIGTVSHEFFHAWNVERIRPKSLEPFDFEKVNMSGALWFAEGFTSYYTNLLLCRAGIISPEKYVEGLTGTFNYVWNSPARELFNPIEMSYQAPFVDAATSIDPMNRENTFISYYSYGSMLGLALDLSLRQNDLNLDDFMTQVWQTYGKPEIPYTLLDLQKSLGQYAGNTFADDFFDKYIYKSGMPNYKRLFESVGVVLSQNIEEAYFGASASLNGDGNGTIVTHPKKGSPAYTAKLDNGDVITGINGSPFPDGQQFETFLKRFAVGDTLSVEFERFGVLKTASVVLEQNPEYGIHLMEKFDEQPNPSQLNNRKAWLKIE